MICDDCRGEKKYLIEIAQQKKNNKSRFPLKLCKPRKFEFEEFVKILNWILINFCLLLSEIFVTGNDKKLLKLFVWCLQDSW